MNLVIDIGNTNTRLAIFDNNKKVADSKTEDLNFNYLDRFIVGFEINKVIISSVKKLTIDQVSLFSPRNAYVHLLSANSELPFINEYESPQTLGTDRLAAVAYAFNLFPGSEVLIIDAGTAITFDYLSGNIYKGGNISPGIAMRFKALNKFTDKLPMVSLNESGTNPGRNTHDAISAGVITGITYEINEYIRTFENTHRIFKVILTGGDGEFLKDKIDHKITYMPDMVINGLNFILDYNAK